MERIQEAIDKARAERQGNIGQTPDMADTVLLSEPKAADSAVAGAEQRSKDSAEQSMANNSKTETASGSAPSTQQNQHSTYHGAGAEQIDGYQSVAYTQTRSEAIDEEVLKENRVIAGFNYDHRVEAYRQLRTQILKLLKDNNWNTLAITSAHEGAGKTLTAVNLAISISREVNHTVMLVDLDLRDPSVHSTLNIDVENGLVDYLQGTADLENILVNPGYQRMVVLPSKPLGKYSSEILSSPEMKRLVTDLRNRYENRIIIFDLPPLLRNDDALMFTPSVDATLMVVEDGVTTEEDLQRSLQLLEGSNLVGTILNKAR
jgi:protein-tyrosine kinase